MAKKKRSPAVIASRQTDAEGYVYSFDSDGRLCFDIVNPERVVLTADLRRYGPGLHIGQLGWTVPGTGDGYHGADVRFDHGSTLYVISLSMARVPPESAEAISAKLIQQYRNTPDDADPAIAATCRQQQLERELKPYVDFDGMETLGSGAEELYAFTFPSLQDLAALRQSNQYPVKVGYTAQAGGAMERVRSLTVEPAAFPERPRLLLAYRTANGRALEAAIHARLRSENRRMEQAVGREWFLTSKEEICALCAQESPRISPANAPDLPPPPVGGAMVFLSIDELPKLAAAHQADLARWHQEHPSS